MCPSFRAIPLAAVLVSLAGPPSIGAEICKPRLSLKEVRFSQVQGMQRLWTATLDVDASRCATTSGRFDIRFVRLKEYAPDLAFTEQLAWQAGQTEVSLVFWADEAVHEHAVVYVAPCPCRN